MDNDKTVRADASMLGNNFDGAIASGNTVSPERTVSGNSDFNGDKTIVDPSFNLHLFNDPGSADGAMTTRSPEMVKNMEYTNPSGDCFILKGQSYTKVSCLSENSGEAQIFLVNKDGKDYVLKVYYPNFNINKKLLQVVMNFQFEMIMNIYDFGKTYVDGKHRYYELMEYLKGGTLQEYKVNGDFNKFRRIALQGASALAFCHLNNILHKDIKPSNFFFRDERHKEIVLGDFGISSLLEKDGKSYRTSQARTPIFAAPEMYIDVIDGEVEITAAADYYSLGMTLFALWLGENPMSTNERVMMKQKNEGRLPRLNELPDKVKRIIQGLTSVNPTSRWKYDEVERWFLGEDVPIDISSPFLRYKSFIMDPDRNLVAENIHELIPLMLDNEKLAINYLYNGRITSWLESCGNTKLSTVVKDIITNRYPVNQKAGLMASIYTMEPAYPYHDVMGDACEDIHSIALSLLSYQERYAIELQNPDDALFLWLESHTSCDVARLRSYFQPESDNRLSVMRMVFEIDPEVPFMAQHPSATIQEIVRSFGYGETTEDDWHSLVDGRLLSWLYSHEDVMACESLRILTHDQPYSKSLAYKVLYNLDRTVGYDLQDANTPKKMAKYLSERLKKLQHMPAKEFEEEMKDIVDPGDRYHYYAQAHGWYQEIAEANRCFDLNSEENRERMSAYDLKTAFYRYCMALGETPTYMLPNGIEVRDGRKLDMKLGTSLRSEIRNGSLLQWMSVFYHENPSKDFSEEYSYEKELKEWLMAVGQIDSQQLYFKRFIKAQEDTTERVKNVKWQWTLVKAKERFWRYLFYGVSLIWIALILIVGIDNRAFLLGHSNLTMFLPLGFMSGVIMAVRSFFKGYGALMSMLFGAVGAASAYIPIYLLKFVNNSWPSMFGLTIVAITLIYIVICHLSDFSRDDKSNIQAVEGLLSVDDMKSSLVEPLYYTFKTRSYKFKSSKLNMLDEVEDRVRSVSGESVLHYVLWSLFMIVLIAEFCVYSPKIMNVKNPDLGGVSASQVMDKIEKELE